MTDTRSRKKRTERADKRQMTLPLSRPERLKLIRDAGPHFMIPGATIRNYRNVITILEQIELCSGYGDGPHNEPGSHVYMETLAARCLLSVNTTRRWVARCEQLGVLIVDRAPRRGGQGSNHYLIQWHRVRQYAQGKTPQTPVKSQHSEVGRAPYQNERAPYQNERAPYQNERAYNKDLADLVTDLPVDSKISSPGATENSESRPPAGRHTAGGGGEFFYNNPKQPDRDIFQNCPLQDFSGFESRLLDLGMFSTAPVIASLRSHGVAIDLAEQCVAFFVERPQAWSVAQLRNRLMSLRPGQDVATCWPPMSAEFAKQQAAEQRERKRLAELAAERERQAALQSSAEAVRDLEQEFGAVLDAMSRAEVLDLVERVRGPGYRRQVAAAGWDSKLTRPVVLRLLDETERSLRINDGGSACLHAIN